MQWNSGEKSLPAQLAHPSSKNRNRLVFELAMVMSTLCFRREIEFLTQITSYKTVDVVFVKFFNVFVSLINSHELLTEVATSGQLEYANEKD